MVHDLFLLGGDDVLYQVLESSLESFRSSLATCQARLPFLQVHTELRDIVMYLQKMQWWEKFEAYVSSMLSVYTYS